MDEHSERSSVDDLHAEQQLAQRLSGPTDRDDGYGEVDGESSDNEDGASQSGAVAGSNITISGTWMR